jgi:hypothetical protein
LAKCLDPGQEGLAGGALRAREHEQLRTRPDTGDSDLAVELVNETIKSRSLIPDLRSGIHDACSEGSETDLDPADLTGKSEGEKNKCDVDNDEHCDNDCENCSHGFPLVW